MFVKFPSIEQFRHVCKEVKQYAKHNNIPVPTLTFTGTVKLHGTNSAVGLNIETGEQFYQSRERLLTIQSDNYGFAMWASGNPAIAELLSALKEKYNPEKSIHVFGEWAGQGVQKIVAISEFPKSFYIFAIKIDDSIWVDIPELDWNHFNQYKIYSISQFQRWSVDIDFNNPENVQNTLVEYTTNVGKECPVAYALGVSGIGEGIVYENKEFKLRFKVKDSAHSSSKVKTVKQIAAVDIEKMNSIKEFAASVVSENRLNQGLAYLTEMQLDNTDTKNLGEFIKWVTSDVFKEESDVIVENQFDTKQVSKEIVQIARNFYLSRV